MARLVIENLSIEQARELAVYFPEAGEQYWDMWMEQSGLISPLIDCRKPTVYNTDEVIIFAK